MFDSFQKTTDSFVMLTNDYLFVNNQLISLCEMEYCGEECHPVICLDNGLLSYTFTSDTSKTEINIVLFPYDMLTPKLIHAMTIENQLMNVNYFDDCMYFRTSNTNAIENDTLFQYCVYNLETGESFIDKRENPIESEINCDHNRSETYSMISKAGVASNCYIVKNNFTGETKQITKDILKNCAEGKSIIKKGNLNIAITDIKPMLEKDGAIYLVGCYLDDGILGYPCHYFVLKYSFENDAVSFYTCIYFEEYQKVIDFLILSNN